jgi:beta-N-acetylhexosaminidase
LLRPVTVAACILGCSGLVLTTEEVALFADGQPWGFILFGRNIGSPDQVRALTAALREAVGREDAPVLVDQEGGRVQRLGPPHWRRYPPGRAYGALSRLDPEAAVEMAGLGGRLLAQDLAAVGITVNCAPVLDVANPEGHDAIGDRAISDNAADVTRLARALAEGLLAGGVLPVIKHMPGQGRAQSDSHHEAPVVKADRAELAACDQAPFRALADLPMAMTGHVIFADIDPARPATISPTVINDVIRTAIGFDGLLITDDLSMAALEGDPNERARAAREAGCDVALYGPGDMAGGKSVLAGAGTLTGPSARRARAALARRVAPPMPFDAADARARFDAAFGGRWAA